ncbi:MAG: hypothetical protein VKK04_09655 [Synechococcales bacterium]|nr:hypothetical protein [Synechococcales bacterium]
MCGSPCSRWQIGGDRPGQILRILVAEADPLPDLGDTLYWWVLELLSQPPFDILPETVGQPWRDRPLLLSDHALLRARRTGKRC